MGIDKSRIHFTSYCWSIGTTSYRTKNFNYNIEIQLELLEDFFNMPENNNSRWLKNKSIQEKYYDFMKVKKFVKGDANRKAKDAREKTSGLVDIGLITENRKLTDVGKKLVDITKEGEFKTHNENFFGIDKDSYIYLLQLLKYTTNENVRPFVVLLKVLNELETITEEEFRYMLPLVINDKLAHSIVEDIKKLRAGYTTIDEIIVDLIWSMDNYKAAFEYFIQHEATEETFVKINMNRKSPKKYDPPYAMLYKKLVEVYVSKNDNSIIELYDAVNNLSGKATNYWKKLLFKSGNKRQIIKNPKKFLKDNKLSTIKDEYEIKKYIYETIHLFKWRNTLDDYFDLNRRYIKLSDIIIFQDGRVSMSLLAKEYFKCCIDDFFLASFKSSDNFNKVVSIENILGNNVPDLEYVYTSIAAHFNEEFIAPEDIQNFVEDERIERFNKMIDEKFDDQKLIQLLNCFEERNDSKLNANITDNADAPTMFEYILGIIWYKLSERKGNILDFMNLSLDADLLPKTHAGGGEADIVYKYEKCNEYPSHELLLEATLADNSNQRRMEMEPVSRHLMKNLMSTGNLNNYAVLASTFIHPSVVSDFRGKAKTEQTLDNQTYFDGIKLLAIDTKVIKNYIISGKKYKDIYSMLDVAYVSNVSLQEGWYEVEIQEKSNL